MVKRGPLEDVGIAEEEASRLDWEGEVCAAKLGRPPEVFQVDIVRK